MADETPSTDVPAPTSAPDDLPPLAALFLIVFDAKVGYKISWQHSIDGVTLEGAVEYKSLPSGLHNVTEDLVYFTHESYSGVSAFVSGSASEAERNAHLAAVGILVPLSYGRMGKSWLYAAHLRQLASTLVANRTDMTPLESFWDSHRLQEGQTEDAQRMTRTPSMGRSMMSPRTRRKRAISDAPLTPGQEPALHASHPARAMLELIDTYGPLIFPLYRLALLRKRILLVTSAPVQRACNFVYNLSVLSTLPQSAAEVLSPDFPEGALRLRTLFAVGVHDIPYLSDEAAARRSASSPTANGWVACTTDDVLLMKRDLYDVAVDLNPCNAPQRAFPTITTSAQEPIKATQLDLRRYRSLRHALLAFPRPSDSDSVPASPTVENTSTTPNGHASASASATLTETTPAQSQSRQRKPSPSPLRLPPSTHPTPKPPHSARSPTPHSALTHDDDTHSDAEDDDLSYQSITEPQSWSHFAYNSFLWWASAGESGDGIAAEETQQSDTLLEELGGLHRSMTYAEAAIVPPPDSDGTFERGISPYPSSPGASRGLLGNGSVEMSLVAYFQRLTTMMVTGLAHLVTLHSDGPPDSEGGLYRDHHEEEEGEENANEDAPLLSRLPSDPPPRPRRRQPRAAVGTDRIVLHSDDLVHIALDVWSNADPTFVTEAGNAWFDRRVVVERSGVECCGVRVC